MSRVWDFTDIEFSVLWRRLVGAGVPRPLTFVTATRDIDEFEQEKYVAWRQVEGRLDAPLRTAIDVLARPEVYLRLRGWRDSALTDPRYLLKVRAGRAGANGYLLYQKPGVTDTSSGGYVLVECGPFGLSEAVVDLMPAVGAGRGGVIALPAPDAAEHAEHRSGASMFFEAAEVTVDQGAAFFDIPADRTGSIEILQNQSMFGSRGMRRDILVWRDLPDDGRYVIALPSAAPTATPMTRDVLVDTIDESIARMMARVESHWEAHR